MTINTISLSNTFFQWVVVTNSLINQFNNFDSGNYTKSTGTLFINSPGVGLHVVSNTNFLGFNRFYDDGKFDKSLSANSLFVDGGGVISGIRLLNNNITLRTSSIPANNASIIVNRGESANVLNANAEIRWNEFDKYWDVRNINNPSQYIKLITKNDNATISDSGIVTLNDNINSASNTLVATANTVKISYDISRNAFNQANTANNNALNAYKQANNAYSTANTNNPLGAFNQANTANNNALNAYKQANAAYSTANTNNPLGAFNQANTANNNALNAYKQANNAGFITTTTTINKTLIKRERCYVTTNNVVLSLPASPNDSSQSDDWVIIVNVGNFTNTTISRNGSKIETIDDDLLINMPNTTISLTYVNSTLGWKL